jgi:hypothetical protein
MMKGEFNPKATRFRNERNLIKVEWLTVLGSSLATSAAVMVAAYVAVHGFLGDIPLWGFNLGNALAILAGLIAAVFMGWATDYAFSDFFKEVLFQLALFFNFKWWKKPENTTVAVHFIYDPILWLLKLALVGLLLWFDIYCIKTSDRPVQSFAKQSKEVDLVGENERLGRTLSTSDYSKQISDVQSEIARKEQNFRSSPTGVAYQKLIAQKNGWAKKEMDAGISAATKADRKKLADLQSKQNKLLSKNQEIMLSTNKALLEKNDRIVKDNMAKRESVSSIFNWFGIGMKVVSLIVMFILVLSFFKKHPNYDANGDGEITYEDVNASFQ